MPVSSTDNSAACIAAINDAVTSAMDEIGARASDYARGTVHVVTGNLRDSIDYDVEGNEVAIFADTDYAAYEELGTSRQDAHPYLKPSVMNHTGEYLDVVANKVKSAIQ